jgi:hypothetical protein
MADFTVPGTWTYDGSANQHQSIYKVDGHSVQENYLVIFDRKPAVLNGSTYSRPSYRIRVQRSFVDGSSVPLKSKAIIDCNITWPVEASATAVKAMITLLGTIFGDAELASDIVDDLDIPRA